MEEVDTHIKSETKMIVKEENDDSDGEYNENDDNDNECNENDDSEENEYELLRKKNMMANLQFLNDLKLLSGIDSIIPKTPEVFKKKRHFTKKRKYLIGSQQPTRKSLRLAGKGSSDLSEIKVEPAEELHEPPLRRFYTGPEDMIQVTDDLDDVKPSFEDLLPCLKEKTTNLTLDQQKSLDRFKGTLKQLVLSPENVKKVGTSKTYSLVIHPTNSKLLIITGDKRGYLSFWDVGNMDKDVDIYHPHRNCIYCLSVCADNPVKLYATAIDGVVRECDLEKMQFNDVYVSENNDHTVYHEQLCPYTLLVAHGCGDVGILDLRESKKVSRWINCHARSVRTIHRHPFKQEEFVTSSGIGRLTTLLSSTAQFGKSTTIVTSSFSIRSRSAFNLSTNSTGIILGMLTETEEVGIWDIRKQKNQKPLLLIPHPKALKSAFFSPGGGMLLTACNDDYIRIYSSDTNHLITKISHNMQTGRWIRPFLPVWHPHRDDAFIVGSLQKPRQVDIYGIHGCIIHSLKSPYLQTILSNNRFHGNREIVAGANSSGVVHVFRAPEQQ